MASGHRIEDVSSRSTLLASRLRPSTARRQEHKHTRRRKGEPHSFCNHLTSFCGSMRGSASQSLACMMLGGNHRGSRAKILPSRTHDDGVLKTCERRGVLGFNFGKSKDDLTSVHFPGFGEIGSETEFCCDASRRSCPPSPARRASYCAPVIHLGFGSWLSTGIPSSFTRAKTTSREQESHQKRARRSCRIRSEVASSRPWAHHDGDISTWSRAEARGWVVSGGEEA